MSYRLWKRKLNDDTRRRVLSFETHYKVRLIQATTRVDNQTIRDFGMQIGAVTRTDPEISHPMSDHDRAELAAQVLTILCGFTFADTTTNTHKKNKKKSNASAYDF